METLQQIWALICPYITGISIGGIISAILYGCLKGAFSKMINKINVEKIADEATKKGVDKIKTMSFKQSIQPLAESELKKITETANAYIDKSLKDVQEKYDHLIAIIEKLSAYFDNSIGVSESAKAELKEALTEAKGIVTSEDIIVEDKPIVEETKVLGTKESPKKADNVEVLR